MFGRYTATAICALFVAVATAGIPRPADAQNTTPPSSPNAAPLASAGTGLALPRYVSLKSDRVNVRKGPGTEYPISFVFRRAGLPVEVLREYEGWREVRDAEGAVGWVTQSLLSGRRTALVEPWAVKPGLAPPEIAIRSSGDEAARAVANVEAGVIANVLACDRKWCEVSVEAFKGYLPQKMLWGVYETEAFR
ncbi:MAG: SH3 domain-containing protein [Hyphomicrobiaceae bacterium]|nr:SH3 domain-containing protein [Hyphomicrobiaceae bacterium]